MEDRITITEGDDRLTLQCGKGQARTLIWSSERGREGRCRAVITQADFQRGSDRKRWVHDLHSFNPASGHAIIKVGEMEPPLPGPRGLCRCIYSWREWDLLDNRELQVLRVCEDPFEKYGVPRKRHKAIIRANDDSVTIDCKVEDWDGCLYTSLYNRWRIELINLHSSYEKYMKEMADHYSMEFVAHFTENRGEFKPPTCK